VQSDYIFHPPSGSSVPGKIEANPYVFYPPQEIRSLLKFEKDESKLEKLTSALKQWERIYEYPGGYPFRIPTARWIAARLRRIACCIKKALVEYPSLNIPDYQERLLPDSFEGILETLDNVHDNYDLERFDYKRDGERPERDQDFYTGDFLTPTDGVMPKIDPKGNGDDPAGLEYQFPPTGGDNY